MSVGRRAVLTWGARALLGVSITGCGADAPGTGTPRRPGAVDASGDVARTAPDAGVWRMPSEESPHERTWMCWPSSRAVWGGDLADVQDAILRIVDAVMTFEPVTLLARGEEVGALRDLVPEGVEILAAPVDDLWARDTLPSFVTRRGTDGRVELGAVHATFNGWGGKQVHRGDAQLAAVAADRLGLDLVDCGLVGEGGGTEVDGAGTVMASVSSWVNANRNPGRTRAQVQAALLAMLGADRMIWVDGLAGADITDGHIDTLARFVGRDVVLVDAPSATDPGDPWVAVAARTREQVRQARTRDGAPYRVVEIVQPSRTRDDSADFLATYMNYYVCNGGVIAPEFGDRQADAAARRVLGELFPERRVVLVDIDPLAAGGGGIHCATQQQPRSG